MKCRRNPIQNIFAFVTVLLVVSCQSPVPYTTPVTEPNSGALHGKVIYSDGQNSGILISIERTDGLRTLSATRSAESRSLTRSLDGSTITDKSGSYSFPSLVPGTYTVYASTPASKEKAVATNVLVESGRTASASDLKLTAIGHVSGTVQIDSAKTDNWGFLVFIAGTSYMAMTDDGGAFTITDVPVSTGYTVLISKGDFLVKWGSVDVLIGTTVSLGTKIVSRSDLTTPAASIVWKGSLETAPSNPSTNWAYYNSTDKKSYIWDGSAWQILAQDGATGATGATGAVGADGTSIVWKGSLATAPTSPQNGWAYYNTTALKSYIWDGSTWQILAQDGSDGAAGANGAVGANGVSVTWKGSFATAPTSPQLNWAYYDSTDKKSYIWDGSAWQILAQDGTPRLVSFDPNGGTGSMASQAFAVGASLTLRTNVFTKAGYHFTGWSTLADGGGSHYADGYGFIMGESDVNLYAEWAANQNQVIFDPNGGIGTPPTQTIATDTSANLATNTFTRSGRLFSGWATSITGTGPTHSDGEIYAMGVSDVTLYAQWKLSVKQISVGAGNTLILLTDGTLWATGHNANGQLADGSTTNRVSPIQVMTDVKSVSCGAAHTMILKTDNTLWAVGWNYYGQLGDGTNIDRTEPVQIMTGVASVAAGDHHTMIVKADGTLWATGANYGGQLGDGTIVDRNSPVQVMTSVKAVYTHEEAVHTMILKTDNTLWAVGGNGSGQLGDGTTDVNKSTPFLLASGVLDVSVGGSNTMVILNDGSLWATGDNTYGQIGDSSNVSKNELFQVMTGVSKVSCGAGYTVIIKTDGSLWATGINGRGQLGDGTTANRNTPVSVAVGISGVYSGSETTFFTRNDGSVFATGNNQHGQFGNGTTQDRSTPLEILF